MPSRIRVEGTSAPPGCQLGSFFMSYSTAKSSMERFNSGLLQRMSRVCRSLLGCVDHMIANFGVDTSNGSMESSRICMLSFTLCCSPDAVACTLAPSSRTVTYGPRCVRHLWPGSGGGSASFVSHVRHADKTMRHEPCRPCVMALTTNHETVAAARG